MLSELYELLVKLLCPSLRNRLVQAWISCINEELLLYCTVIYCIGSIKYLYYEIKLCFQNEEICFKSLSGKTSISNFSRSLNGTLNKHTLVGYFGRKYVGIYLPG